MEDLKNRTHFYNVKTEEDARLPVPIPLIPFDFPQPRANLRYLSRTTTTLSYRLEGLSQAANKYGKFDMAVTKVSTGQQVYYNSWTSSNSSNSTDHTAKELEPGTEYYVVCEAYTNDWYPVGSATNWTEAAPDNTGPTCSNMWVSASGWVNNRSVAVSFEAVDNVAIREMTFGWKRSWESANDYKTETVDGKNGTIASHTFYFNIDDADYTTTYNFVGSAKDSSGNESSNNQKVYKNVAIGYDATGPSVTNLWAKMNGQNITANAISSDARSGVAGHAYYISGPNDSVFGSANTISSSGQSQITFTTDRGGNAFVHDRVYKIKVTSWDSLSNWASEAQTKTISFKYDRPAPDPWTWSSGASNAFRQKGKTTDLKVGEWNNFIKKVVAFSQWYNPNLETKSISDCEMYIPGKNSLLASDFNKIKNRILAIKSNSWHMENVGTGHLVRGKYFLDMATSLNSCSKTLSQEIDEFDNETIENVYERLFIEIENGDTPEYPSQ